MEEHKRKRTNLSPWVGGPSGANVTLNVPLEYRGMDDATAQRLANLMISRGALTNRTVHIDPAFDPASRAIQWTREPERYTGSQSSDFDRHRRPIAPSSSSPQAFSNYTQHPGQGFAEQGITRVPSVTNRYRKNSLNQITRRRPIPSPQRKRISQIAVKRPLPKPPARGFTGGFNSPQPEHSEVGSDWETDREDTVNQKSERKAKRSLTFPIQNFVENAPDYDNRGYSSGQYSVELPPRSTNPISRDWTSSPTQTQELKKKKSLWDVGAKSIATNFKSQKSTLEDPRQYRSASSPSEPRPRRRFFHSNSKVESNSAFGEFGNSSSLRHEAFGTPDTDSRSTQSRQFGDPIVEPRSARPESPKRSGFYNIVVSKSRVNLKHRNTEYKKKEKCEKAEKKARQLQEKQDKALQKARDKQDGVRRKKPEEQFSGKRGLQISNPILQSGEELPFGLQRNDTFDLQPIKEPKSFGNKALGTFSSSNFLPSSFSNRNQVGEHQLGGPSSHGYYRVLNQERDSSNLAVPPPANPRSSVTHQQEYTRRIQRANINIEANKRGKKFVSGYWSFDEEQEEYGRDLSPTNPTPFEDHDFQFPSPLDQYNQQSSENWPFVDTALLHQQSSPSRDSQIARHQESRTHRISAQTQVSDPGRDFDRPLLDRSSPDFDESYQRSPSRNSESLEEVLPGIEEPVDTSLSYNSRPPKLKHLRNRHQPIFGASPLSLTPSPPKLKHSNNRCQQIYGAPVGHLEPIFGSTLVPAGASNGTGLSWEEIENYYKRGLSWEEIEAHLKRGLEEELSEAAIAEARKNTYQLLTANAAEESEEEIPEEKVPEGEKFGVETPDEKEPAEQESGSGGEVLEAQARISWSNPESSLPSSEADQSSAERKEEKGHWNNVFYYAGNSAKKVKYCKAGGSRDSLTQDAIRTTGDFSESVTGIFQSVGIRIQKPRNKGTGESPRLRPQHKAARVPHCPLFDLAKFRQEDTPSRTDTQEASNVVESVAGAATTIRAQNLPPQKLAQALQKFIDPSGREALAFGTQIAGFQKTGDSSVSEYLRRQIAEQPISQIAEQPVSNILIYRRPELTGLQVDRSSGVSQAVRSVSEPSNTVLSGNRSELSHHRRTDYLFESAIAVRNVTEPVGKSSLFDRSQSRPVQQKLAPFAECPSQALLRPTNRQHSVGSFQEPSTVSEISKREISGNRFQQPTSSSKISSLKARFEIQGEQSSIPVPPNPHYLVSQKNSKSAQSSFTSELPGDNTSVAATSNFKSIDHKEVSQTEARNNFIEAGSHIPERFPESLHSDNSRTFGDNPVNTSRYSGCSATTIGTSILYYSDEEVPLKRLGSSEEVKDPIEIPRKTEEENDKREKKVGGRDVQASSQSGEGVSSTTMEGSEFPMVVDGHHRFRMWSPPYPELVPPPLFSGSRRKLTETGTTDYSPVADQPTPTSTTPPYPPQPSRDPPEPPQPNLPTSLRDLDNTDRTSIHDKFETTSFLDSGLTASVHPAMMDLLSVRSTERESTKTKAAEDARQMQAHVVGECKKSGTNPPKYLLLELIGKGSFGRVYKAKDLTSTAIVAVKIIDIDEGDTLNPRLADTYSDFMKEVNALKVLSDQKAKNINHVIEALPVGKAMWMITEHCGGGSVSTLMRPTPRGLQERFIVPILREVAEAVHWVHQAGIIHRDLKCANVLITEMGGVQLCDFGVAGVMETSLDKRSTFIGTMNWMAPELFEPNPHYGKEVDIWAFGSMAYEMATGMPPNAKSGMNSRPEMGHYLKQHIPRLEGDQYSEGLKDLVAYCLEERILDRPDIDSVQQHAYIYHTNLQYPVSSLSELVKAFKHWEESGGYRKSLFMMGGAQGPSDISDTLSSNGSQDDWNFSTTPAFDMAVGDSTNLQDVINVYGSSVDLTTEFADHTSKPSRQQQTRERGRRRPPPEALIPIKAPLEKLFDPNTISNYEDNSRIHYGRDFVIPTSDLPLREKDETAQISIRDTMIDLGGHDIETGLSSFPDLTIRPDGGVVPDEVEYDYNNNDTLNHFGEPSFSEPVGNLNRRTQDWKFPSGASSSTDPETSRFPNIPDMTRPSGTLGFDGGPTLIHHPTEPVGHGFNNFVTSVPTSPTMSSRESLIDLDFGLPDTTPEHVPELSRPSTAGSTTSNEFISGNPFDLERHASSAFQAVQREPSLYLSGDSALASHLRSDSNLQDHADTSEISAPDTEPYGPSNGQQFQRRPQQSFDYSDSDYPRPPAIARMRNPPSTVVRETPQISRYSMDRFPELPAPPSMAALAGTATSAEMADELQRLLGGLTAQLEAYRVVSESLPAGQNAPISREKTAGKE